MIYWIADGDVSSALALKKKIQSEKFFQSHCDVVEVFYDLGDLLKKFAELNKKKSEKPRVLMMDPYTLEDPDFDQLYPVWEAWCEEVLLICMTAMSLGRLEIIYQRRDMILLSFLKSELDRQWEFIVTEMKAKIAYAEPKAPQYAPKLKAAELALKGQLREFEKKYYLKTLDTVEVKVFVSTQAAGAEKLGLSPLSAKLEKISQLFAQPVSPGTMRLRKEIREYLLLAHKVFPDLDT